MTLFTYNELAEDGQNKKNKEINNRRELAGRVKAQRRKTNWRKKKGYVKHAENLTAFQHTAECKSPNKSSLCTSYSYNVNTNTTTFPNSAAISAMVSLHAKSRHTENWALLVSYVASSGSFLPTFRDNLSGPIIIGQAIF